MENRDRVAVITGATGGLGRTAARKFAEQGLRLALISSSDLKLDQLIHELRVPDGQARKFAANLTEPDAVARAAKFVMETYGRADILMHLVGGWVGGTAIPEADPGDLEEMLSQHAWSTFYLLKAFIPLMQANGWGRILVVSSPSAVSPSSKNGLYAAGKAAQEALILSAAASLTGSGVTANILQVRTIDVQHQRDQERTAENAGWTTAEEITAAALYLCSEEGQVVNGARIPLYGGS